MISIGSRLLTGNAASPLVSVTGGTVSADEMRVRELAELRVPPGNRLELLQWEDGHAYAVEVTDYH